VILILLVFGCGGAGGRDAAADDFGGDGAASCEVLEMRVYPGEAGSVRVSGIYSVRSCSDTEDGRDCSVVTSDYGTTYGDTVVVDMTGYEPSDDWYRVVAWVE